MNKADWEWVIFSPSLSLSVCFTRTIQYAALVKSEKCLQAIVLIRIESGHNLVAISSTSNEGEITDYGTRQQLGRG